MTEPTPGGRRLGCLLLLISAAVVVVLAYFTVKAIS